MKINLGALGVFQVCEFAVCHYVVLMGSVPRRGQNVAVYSFYIVL